MPARATFGITDNGGLYKRPLVQGLVCVYFSSLKGGVCGFLNAKNRGIAPPASNGTET